MTTLTEHYFIHTSTTSSTFTLTTISTIRSREIKGEREKEKKTNGIKNSISVSTSISNNNNRQQQQQTFFPSSFSFLSFYYQTFPYIKSASFFLLPPSPTFPPSQTPFNNKKKTDFKSSTIRSYSFERQNFPYEACTYPSNPETSNDPLKKRKQQQQRKTRNRKDM